LHLARALDGDGDRDGVVDGAIVGVAVATVACVVIFQPPLLETGGTSRVHVFLGPVVYAAIAGIISRFALVMPRRCAAAWLLVAATVGALTGNLLRTATEATTSAFVTGSVADAFLVFAYVAVAVATVHPSVHMLGDAP